MPIGVVVIDRFDCRIIVYSRQVAHYAAGLKCTYNMMGKPEIMTTCFSCRDLIETMLALQNVVTWDRFYYINCYHN